MCRGGFVIVMFVIDLDGGVWYSGMVLIDDLYNDNNFMIDEVVKQYPVINRDWAYVNLKYNMFEIMEVCVNTYGRFRHGIYYKKNMMEQTAYNRRMNECKMRFRGVNSFFIRRLSKINWSEYDVYSMDPWNRRFVVYGDTVLPGGNMTMNHNKYFGGNDVYFGGYVFEDVVCGEVICNVSVTTVNGLAVYCLDAYKFDHTDV